MERFELGATRYRAASPAPSVARRDRGLALLVGVLAATGYWLLRQDATWSDGRDLIVGLERGQWSYHHILYFPTAHLLHGLFGWALDVEGTLQLLSAGSAALSVGLFYRVAREYLPRGPALASSTLFATAPSVVFYATTVEVHALQLPFAVGAVLWAVRRRTSEGFRENAWLPVALLCGLVGTHVTGLAWSLSCAYVLFRGSGRWAMPRRWLAAGLVLLGFLVSWLFLQGTSDIASGHVLLGLRKTLTPWQPGLLWREVLEPAGLLYGCAIVALIAFPVIVRAARSTIRASILLLLAPVVPFAMTVGIFERGAYFISLVPVVAVLALQWMRFVRTGPAVVVALVLGVVQGGWALRNVDDWVHHYPGNEWIEALLEETGERGIVLTSHLMEVSCIQGHSGMAVLYVRTRGKLYAFGSK